MYTIEPSCVKVDGILYFISKYSNIPTIKASFGIFKHLIGITRIPRKPVFIQSLIDVTDINIWTSLITWVHLHFFVGFVLRIL
jgi:hypothetical protein